MCCHTGIGGRRVHGVASMNCIHLSGSGIENTVATHLLFKPFCSTAGCSVTVSFFFALLQQETRGARGDFWQYTVLEHTDALLSNIIAKILKFLANVKLIKIHHESHK